MWQKGYDIDDEVFKFTVGKDQYYDAYYAKHEILTSIAHAAGLKKAGILTTVEFSKLKNELKKIYQLILKNKFVIPKTDEDVHTTVENRLIAKLGVLGKKIHTGRSRNEQCIHNQHFYAKEKLLDILHYTIQCADILYSYAKKYEMIPMPGYTHMQKAMPASVGMWMGSFLEALLDNITLLKCAYDINNQSGLGSAAGFGVDLKLDRQYTAQLMGYDKVQKNCMYVAASRGMLDSNIIYAYCSIMNTLAKLSGDILMFTMAEFKFFKLPDKFCTGSSLMPQKKNGDVFELVRAKSKVMFGYLVQEMGLYMNLPSGYNRDSQITKEPIMESTDLIENTLKIVNLTIPGLQPIPENLRAAFSPDIFATDYALELVKKGMPFRDAYRKVAQEIGQLKAIDPDKNIRSKKHIGATGNLQLNVSKAEITKNEKWLKTEKNNFDKAISNLLK